MAKVLAGLDSDCSIAGPVDDGCWKCIAAKRMGEGMQELERREGARTVKCQSSIEERSGQGGQVNLFGRIAREPTYMRLLSLSP